MVKVNEWGTVLFFYSQNWVHDSHRGITLWINKVHTRSLITYTSECPNKTAYTASLTPEVFTHSSSHLPLIWLYLFSELFFSEKSINSLLKPENHQPPSPWSWETRGLCWLVGFSSALNKISDITFSWYIYNFYSHPTDERLTDLSSLYSKYCICFWGMFFFHFLEVTNSIIQTFFCNKILNMYTSTHFCIHATTVSLISIGPQVNSAFGFKRVHTS